MEKVRNNASAVLPERREFPPLRKSHSAQQSLDAELLRLRRMSIEERVVEALSIENLFGGLEPSPKDA